MNLDAELLDRYARTRDADAFTQLVRRHAGMVFAVARRVTGDHHDAEEVAQACFVELARQAASIHGSLAGWLHTVATTRAANLNRDAGRRRRHERAAARPEAQSDSPWVEISPLVDAAMAELPDDLRIPLLLYHLQGRTQAEVAAELDMNQGMVSRCLEAGVAALREKLKAAGAMAPSVALPALLAAHGVEAVPRTLVAELGKLAVSGVVPGAGGASGGGIGIGGKAAGAPLLHGGGASGAVCGTAAPGTVSAATKGAVPLVVKVAAVIAIATAVSTTGFLVMRRPVQPVVAIAAAVPATGDELKDVIARLSAQVKKGMGDGVGIYTETDIDINHSKPRDPVPNAIMLYAQKGESRLGMWFRAGSHHDWGNPKAILPKSWPVPDLDEAMRFVGQLRTPYVDVTDGRTWWRHEGSKGESIRLVSSLLAEGDTQFGSPVPSALIHFWPSQKSLMMPVSTKGQLPSIELVHRPDNPALVGLHITNEPVPKRISEITYWLDPSRNDVTVEKDYKSYDLNGKNTLSGKLQFLEFAQLPDGRWYPTHWLVSGFAGPAADDRLIFDPGKSLDDSWFGDPTAHFAANPGAAAAAGQQSTGVAAVPQAIVTTAVTVAHSVGLWWPWALAVSVLGAAGVLFIRQRRSQSPAPPLRGAYGPRRRG